MCRTATCQACGKATWAGCGNHVDQVMRNVPPSRRCTCSKRDRDAAAAVAPRRGWLSRLLGR